MDTTSRVPETDGFPPDESMAVKFLNDATEHEAELQGHWAYSFGRSSSTNPYAGFEMLQSAWLTGWRDAEANCEG